MVLKIPLRPCPLLNYGPGARFDTNETHSVFTLFKQISQKRFKKIDIIFFDDKIKLLRRIIQIFLCKSIGIIVFYNYRDNSDYH